VIQEAHVEGHFALHPPEDLIVFYGIWQLTKQSLTADVRRGGSHAIRFGLAVVLYFAVCYACFLSWSNASGLPLFQAQLMITALFLSATAIFGFSQKIAEEKEEETLGLMRLADISPLSIILGKTMGILCDAALLIAIQYPFTIVAITLGGVSWAQVYAAYIALAAYLWFLAMIGITVSVFQPNGGKAAQWTAIIVAAYSLPYFFLWAFGTLWGWKALQALWPISLPMRMLEITESGFQDSPWCLAVGFGAVVGLICLIASWLSFDRFALTEARNDRPLGLKLTPRRSRRCWSKPIIWREYFFATGGIPWTVMRIGVQLAIFFAVLTTFGSFNRPNGIIGFTLAWSSILSGLFGILDGTWFASRLFQDEVRNRTWSALVQTPHSLPQLALEKCCGWAVGLAPTIVSPFVFVLLMMIFHEHIPRNVGAYVELIIGTTTIGLSVFGYLHLLVLLSLYFGWKGTPMTLTICFAAGWLYVVAVYTSSLGDEARCGLFGVTSLVLVGLMLVLELLILQRLERLAETA
jgi:ABC-type transport system involved in cytochrome c biogenesis permease component